MENTTTNMKDAGKQYKSIFSARVARGLLKKGERIADIKPDKNNHDRSIFVFEITPGFFDNLKEVAATKKQVETEPVVEEVTE